MVGEPVKVAVLGGGIGAMAAAFELTGPELEGRYEVTVYQPGWRLGGKCASGRGSPGSRIEEHGLHVWFGFYANAFALIQRCYEDWTPPADAPLTTWQEAFKPCNDIVLLESWRGEWKPWHIRMPDDNLVPGSDHDVTEWQFLCRLLGWLLTEWGVVRARRGDVVAAGEGHAPAHHGLMARLAGDIGHPLEHLGQDLVTRPLELALKVAEAHTQHPERHAGAVHHLGALEHLLNGFRRWFFRHVLERAIDDDDVRRFAILLDFWATTMTGMVADNVFEEGFGQLNGEDLRAWLTRHGADKLTLEHASLIQALYDLVFAYQDGNKEVPDLAAGKALQAMIRIVVEYKGAALWKMQSGMGDTVFTPLYDVLRARGVRFRFFHQVTKLTVSQDGGSVGTIEVQPQVHLKDDEYDPIVSVGGLRCWPSEPAWDQLVEGAELRERGVNLEQACNPLGLEPITLRADEDFDEIVLGISVGALKDICGELCDVSAPFRLMLENSFTVMTEGIQLWLTQAASALGWPYEPAIATSYVNEADTYSNMSQLLERESWSSADRPNDIVYLCGVIRHDGVNTQADADASVRANALRFLREAAGRLWPHAVDRGGGGFDWGTLFDPARASGDARLDAQFLRANFQPTERYVMTRAKTVQYRLRADESGFANLKLAGDWTRNGIDGGSVEAAVTSGMQASRAICGSPAQIQGEHGWLVAD
jgi:uncharacterized protein with NAD-binding domain and iron-sulfur cluster